MKNIAQRILVLLFFISPLAVSAHEGNDHYGPHMMWQGYGMVFGPFMMIIFIVAIIVVGVLLVRWLGGHGIGSHAKSGQEAIEILKTRFARGEIDKEEFEERVQLLQKGQ